MVDIRYSSIQDTVKVSTRSYVSHPRHHWPFSVYKMDFISLLFHVHTWAVVSTHGEVKESLCLDKMAAAATHVSAKTSQDSELHKLHLFYIKPVRLNEWADKLLRIQCEPKYTPIPPHWPEWPWMTVYGPARLQWQLVKLSGLKSATDAC